MTPKQVAYIENRIAGLDPQAAAIAAGYAATGANQVASSLEKRADVQKAIKKKAKPEQNAGRSAGGRKSVGQKVDELAAAASGDKDNWMRDHYDSPLDMMTHIMNEPRAPKGMRFESAKIAFPFVHGKVAPAAGKGKKEQQEERAKEQSRNGKFARRSAPRATGITVN